MSIVVANLMMEDIEQKALSTFHTLHVSGGNMLMTRVPFCSESMALLKYFSYSVLFQISNTFHCMAPLHHCNLIQYRNRGNQL